MATRFPFRFDPTHRRLTRLFGVTPERAWVDPRDEELEALRPVTALMERAGSPRIERKE
jgi:hypothetical protein